MTERNSDTSDPGGQRSTVVGAHALILVQNLPVPFDRRVWQEAQCLRRAGYEVTVVCPADGRHPSGEFHIDGVNVRRFDAVPEADGSLGYVSEYGLSLWRMFKSVTRHLRSEAVDVVHFCNPPDLLFLLAFYVKARHRVPVIFDQHDLGPELVVAKHMKPKRPLVAIARLFEFGAYRVANHVIATNESYKRIAISRGGHFETTTTVVRSGPPLDWSSEVPPDSTWRKDHEFLVGYVGVMGKQEGIIYLLEAAKILRSDYALDVGFALVGSGPERTVLENLASDLGVLDCVTFYGRVPDDQLKSILYSSDVCVNPDEVNPMNSLSTMNKIVEYMALGRPIVQFDMIEGRHSAGGASLYAAANDSHDLARKIYDVLTNRELASRMSEIAVTRFRDELSWESQQPSLLRAYELAMLRVKA